MLVSMLSTPTYGAIAFDRAQKSLDAFNSTSRFAQVGDINASTASNDELESFGIPDRPTDPAQLDQWNKTYGQIKEIGQIAFLKSDEVPHANWSIDDWMPNWCGGVNFNNAMKTGYNPDGYQKADGIFTVPDLSQYEQLDGKKTAVSPWVGLGGFNSDANDSLIQAGITARYDGTTKPTGTASYCAWFEDYSQIPSSDYHKSAPVTVCVNGEKQWFSPGDQLACTVEINSDGTQMGYCITDCTTGLSTGLIWASTTVPLDSPKAISNQSAEWITEDNMGSNYKLAKYGSIEWEGTYGYGKTKAIGNACGINPLAAGTSYAEGVSTVYDKNTNQIVSQPSDSQHFTTTWKDY